jgi:D-alanine-D-alanine ligase
MPSPSVIFGGPSWEHDVSILTGLQALRVLARGGAEPIGLYWSELNGWFRVPADLEASAFLDGVPREGRPVSLEVGGAEPGFYESRSLGRRSRVAVSAAVVCCHGGPGEDGRLQGMLDLAGIAYTGPSSACAALTMDKLAFGGVVEAAKLPALPRISWSASSPEPPFAGPYIVKPRFGGSSIGIEVVHDIDTARDLIKASPYLSRGAVLEQYRPGLEDLYIAIRTYPELQFSLIERPRPRNEDAAAASDAQIYGYKQKYLEQQGAESKVSEIPARLPEETEKTLRMMAEEIARLTRLTGAARLDFLWDGSQLWVNELNSIPGALAFRLWAESGVSHEDLLSDMLAEAAATSSLRDIDPPDRFANDRKTQTLQSAGKIAAKLT